MIITARKFVFFLIFSAVFNFAVHLFYLLHPSPSANESHRKVPRKYLGRERIDISMNWKILYDSIVCNIRKDVTVVESEEEACTKHNISDSLMKSISDEQSFDKVLCPQVPPNLGPVSQDRGIMDLHGIDDMYLRIELGGVHVPRECVARQKVAIIVAVHETDKAIRRHIGSFMYYMHPFLMKQQLEYQIFVVVKNITDMSYLYERGRLFNIGYIEAQTYRNEGWDCIIFHDAQLLPLDTRNMYRCTQRPKKLNLDFRKPIRFGGAIAMRPEHFIKVNGFSNYIWSDDDDYIDMYRRLMAANFTIATNISPIGSYTTYNFLWQVNKIVQQEQTPPNYLKDGLSTLFYSVNHIEARQFYTLIEVVN